MSKNEHDEWPQRDGESDFDYLLRCLAEHKESHIAWAKHLEVYPPESERAEQALGTAPEQWADAARYDKLIAIVAGLGDLKSQWDAQKEKRMVVNLDENCIETIKRLTENGGEEISFGGNMGGILLRWAPNFPRSSQNRTASSGVDGVHEGTTADKSGSREPEKLNSAHKLSERSKVELLANDIWDSNRRLLPDYNAAVELAEWLRRNYNVLALAESSLSSPPPVDKRPAHRCSDDRPHSPHTFGGRPVEYCAGVE